MRSAELADLLAGSVDSWPPASMRWRPPEILDAELEELADRIAERERIRSRITRGITTRADGSNRVLEATNRFIQWPAPLRAAYNWAGEPTDPEPATNYQTTEGTPTGRGTYLHTDPR